MIESRTRSPLSRLQASGFSQPVRRPDASIAASPSRGALRPRLPGARGPSRRGGGFGLLLLALLASGCSSHPEGVLRPVATGPTGGARVDMLVATTRAPSGDPGTMFTGERGDGMSLAKIVMSLPPGREVGTIQWPRRVPGDPQRDFVTESVTPLQKTDVPRWFAQAGARQHRVFVFIHGFNTRFDAAVFRFAQIAHDTDAGAAPVLFTWPSRGRILDYNYDRESANFSRTDLANLLRTAVASPQVSEVTVLAHSMGAWVAVEALRQMALSDGRISPKINNVVLASPDLDVDVFLRQMQDIGTKRPRFTVFTSNGDRALGVSSLISGRMTRLGGIDVTGEDYRRKFAGIPDLVFIDMSQLRSGDAFNHNAFATSPKAVRLIGDRLITGQPITDSDAVAPVDAAQTLGSAAGTLVAAPFLIFNRVQNP